MPDRVPALHRLRHRALAGIVAATAIIALASPAWAVCAICNASVRLDKSLAVCLVDRVDKERDRLKSEGRGFVIVDLSDCPKVGDRGGLPTGPATKATVLDASFVADDDSLRCLGAAIAEHATELDPSHVFDLTQICS